MKMKEWKALGLILLAVALWGCQSGNESAATDKQEDASAAAVSEDVPNSEVSAAAQSGNKEPSSPSQQEKRAVSRSAARITDKAPIAPSRRVNRASARPVTPKGMAAHSDFTGARVGLIQTANVMGEVDPCG